MPSSVIFFWYLTVKLNKMIQIISDDQLKVWLFILKPMGLWTIYTKICSIVTFFWSFNLIMLSLLLFFLPATGTPANGKPKKWHFLVSRWRQFWYAPVISFIGNVLMYFLFLFLYAYVLLVDFKPPPPAGPAASEYVLYFWVFTIVCEEIREVSDNTSVTFVNSFGGNRL